MLGFNKKSPPLILVVLLCVILSVTQVSAGVSDNVVTAKLESAVGAYEDSKEAHTVFGLLHYLVYQIDQLRSDLADVKVAVSQIKVSSDMQNETVINTYLQQLKDGKYTSIAAYTSSVKIQEAMATSPIVINSDRSGFALDWLIANGRDLNIFFSQLDGFNYTVPEGYTIDQFVADDNCWNHLRNCTYKLYTVGMSNYIAKNANISRRYSSTGATLSSSWSTGNMYVVSVAYSPALSGWNGPSSIYNVCPVYTTDIYGTNRTYIGSNNYYRVGPGQESTIYATLGFFCTSVSSQANVEYNGTASVSVTYISV